LHQISCTFRISFRKRAYLNPVERFFYAIAKLWVQKLNRVCTGTVLIEQFDKGRVRYEYNRFSYVLMDWNPRPFNRCNCVLPLVFHNPFVLFLDHQKILTFIQASTILNQSRSAVDEGIYSLLYKGQRTCTLIKSTSVHFTRTHKFSTRFYLTRMHDIC
jgi:hypothetical protein